MNLLTTDEVAARLRRRNTHVVARLIARGDIRGVKDGGRWLVDEADLEAYIAGLTESTAKTTTTTRRRRRRS